MSLALGGDMRLHLAPAGRWYGADTAFLPSPHHAGLLLEFARQRELVLPPATLRSAAAGLISPQVLLDLLAEVVRVDRAPDTAFLLGQAWWPGHAGAASHALAHAGDLAQALSLLVEQAAGLSPLLTPRWVLGPKACPSTATYTRSGLEGCTRMRPSCPASSRPMFFQL